MVSLSFYLIFFIYKIYYLNSFREEEGKIIPKLTNDLDNKVAMKNDNKLKEKVEEVLLLNNKINELQITIKKLESEVYNLYNLIRIIIYY